MLLVGLTGGIGAGKSTVSRELAARGAVVIDADQLAREVVAPGTPGLAAIVEAFGPDVLTAEGSLDRAALGSIVFAADDARTALNAIVHPAVAARFEEEVAAAPADAIVVHDVPLLVENDLGPGYHVVIVAHAPREVRLERLLRDRGMSAEEAGARMAAQADDAARRAAADVWIDNSGDLAATAAQAAELWSGRLVPYEENVRLRRPADRVAAAMTSPPIADPWAAQAARVIARLRRAGGEAVLDAEHVGSTAVPGLVAKDVLDVQLGVATLAEAARVAEALGAAGFPVKGGISQDTPKPGLLDPGQWRKVFCASADPGRAVNVHIRVSGSVGWEWALAFRDWLRDDDDARAEYAALKARLVAEHASRAPTDEARGPTSSYADAKEPWFTEVAAARLAAWRAQVGWRPPGGEE